MAAVGSPEGLGDVFAALASAALTIFIVDGHLPIWGLHAG
jgi:hypothetical protein